jgi:hypothetical protein
VFVLNTGPQKDPWAGEDDHAMLASRFYLVRPDDRVDEWDEMYTLMEIEAPDRWLCYALDAGGAELDYYDVKFAVGHMRLVPGVNAHRTVPVAGAPVIVARMVNWVCQRGGGAMWSPPHGAALAALMEDAGGVAALLPPRGRRGDRRIWSVTDLVQQAPPLPLVAAAGADAVVAVAGLAPGPAAEALRPQMLPVVLPLDDGGGLAPPGGGPNEDLMAAVRAVQVDLERLALGKKSSGTAGSDSYAKKSKHKKKKKGSGSDSSRSSTSSSSSSGRGKKKRKRRRLVKWRASDMSKKDVSAEELRNMETMRFKSRADLMRVAAEEPGALAAQFLIAVRLALHGGPPSTTRDLLKVDVQRWAREHTGLTERRDQREIQTLMMVMAKVSDGEYAHAVDVIAQRAKSLLQAKSTKGSWEKSQVIELLASGGGIVPQSEITLTGLGNA